MSGERQAPGQPGLARRQAIDIRALLINRAYIKETTYLLPRRAKIQVLTMMERLRRDRTAARSATGIDAGPLPEMTGPELVREINWRIGTLPPHDAEAISRFLRRLTWRRPPRRPRQDRGVAPASPPKEAGRR